MYVSSEATVEVGIVEFGDWRMLMDISVGSTCMLVWPFLEGTFIAS